jgi:hypothetical protein
MYIFPVWDKYIYISSLEFLYTKQYTRKQTNIFDLFLFSLKLKSN